MIVKFSLKPQIPETEKHQHVPIGIDEDVDVCAQVTGYFGHKDWEKWILNPKGLGITVGEFECLTLFRFKKENVFSLEAYNCSVSNEDRELTFKIVGQVVFMSDFPF